MWRKEKDRDFVCIASVCVCLYIYNQVAYQCGIWPIRHVKKSKLYPFRKSFIVTQLTSLRRLYTYCSREREQNSPLSSRYISNPVRQNKFSTFCVLFSFSYLYKHTYPRHFIFFTNIHRVVYIWRKFYILFSSFIII